ncbi:MAG: hypothetical protein AAFP78_04950 [Pseudomonadota bacterium]
MAHDEETLMAHYLDLLSRTGVEWDWYRIEFHPTHAGHPHVEFNEDGSWTLAETDRGVETGRARFIDLHLLMFELCSLATWAAALHQVGEPNLHVNELTDRTYARQIEMMGRIDRKWAQRLSVQRARSRVDPREFAKSEAARLARERKDRLIMAAVYAGCAALVAASIGLGLWLG